jgi:hypothetical protein
MKRILMVAVLAVAPSLSWAAAATWSVTTGDVRSNSAVCAGTGVCDAPSAATDGILLDSVEAVRIRVCADSGQTVNGGTVTLYSYDAASPLWAKASSAYTLLTGARCVEVAGDSPGLGIPVIGVRGRLAVKLDATLSAGGATVHLLGSGPKSVY